MKAEEKKEIAARLGVHLHTVRRWCREMTDEEVRLHKPMHDMAARGRRSKAKGHWTKFMLPGSLR